MPTSFAASSNAAATVFQIAPGYRSPYTWDSTASVSRSIRNAGTASLSYTYGRGAHLAYTRNANAPLPGTYIAGVATSGVRPLGTLENVYRYESGGISRGHRLQASLTLRGAHQFYLFSQYTLRYQRSDASSLFPSNDYDVRADYGPAQDDIRHSLIFDMGAELPYLHSYLSMFMSPSSGAPFNIVAPTDLNGDSQFNDRPAFATDLSRPSVVATSYGTFDTQPTAGQTIIPFDYGRGSAQFSVNLLLYHRINFGPEVRRSGAATAPAGGTQSRASRRYNVTLAVEAENVLNHSNFGLPVGTLGSSLFGQPTSLAPSAPAPNASRVINLLLVGRF
jgi:hypothetical protein